MNLTRNKNRVLFSKSKTRRQVNSSEKRLILTFIIGKDRSYSKYTKSHMKEYADKCNADFLLLSENDHIIKKHSDIFKDLQSGRDYGGTSWFLKVSIIHHFLNTYDKVLWLDDTCIVSPYTENIFNKVKDGSIAAVKDKSKAINWNRAYLKLMTNSEIDRDKFINSGVVVYTKKMKDILSIKNILEYKHLFLSKYPHQAYLTYMFYKNNIPIVLLNKQYNDLYLHYTSKMIRNTVNKEYIIRHCSSIFHITSAWKNRTNVIKKIDSIIKEYKTSSS